MWGIVEVSLSKKHWIVPAANIDFIQDLFVIHV